MKEFLNGWAEAPDGVKLFFVMCVLTMIICLIAAVYLGWKEYQEDHLKGEFWIRRKDKWVKRK